MEREASCARNEKWITSLAAIVAPHTCDVVRGALVLVAPARPAMSFAFLYFFVPSTLTFTKMLCFVFPDLHDVLFCPAPVSASIHAYLF